MNLVEFLKMLGEANVQIEGMPLVIMFVAAAAGMKAGGKYLEKLGESLAGRHVRKVQEDIAKRNAVIVEKVRFESATATLKMQKLEQLMSHIAAVTGTSKDDVINIQAAHAIAQLFLVELQPAVANLERRIVGMVQAQQQSTAPRQRRRQDKAAAALLQRDAQKEVRALVAQISAEAAAVMRGIERTWAGP